MSYFLKQLTSLFSSKKEQGNKFSYESEPFESSYHGKYSNQLKRIEEKLLLAKKKDTELKTFGSSSHQYIMCQPESADIQTTISEFEQKYNIELPESYKAFMLKYPCGGAGPDYGIYPFGKNFNVMLDAPEKGLSQPCVLFTDEWSWDNWDDNIEAGEARGDSDDLANTLYAGTLVIGTTGCSGYIGLILNGNNKGRVFNFNTEMDCPDLTFEDHFLDWYEHWLDDVISGRAMKGQATFGQKLANEDPFKTLLKETDLNVVDELLADISGLETITTGQGKQLLALHERYGFKTMALDRLSSFYPEMTLSIFQSIVTDFEHESYKKVVDMLAYRTPVEVTKSVAPHLAKRLEYPIEDDGFFYNLMTALEKTDYNYSREIIPFFSHSNKDIQGTAFYQAGNIKDKSPELAEALKQSLKTSEPSNLVSLLQAIDSTINNASFLPYYRYVLDRHYNESYVVVNVLHRLKELGLEAFSNKEIKESIIQFIDKNTLDAVSNALFILHDADQDDLLAHAAQHTDKEIATHAKALQFIQKMKQLAPDDFKPWLDDQVIDYNSFDLLSMRMLYLLDEKSQQYPFYPLNFSYLEKTGHMDKLIPSLKEYREMNKSKNY